MSGAEFGCGEENDRVHETWLKRILWIFVVGSADEMEQVVLQSEGGFLKISETGYFC